MHATAVLDLQRHRDYPSVSILLRTEPGRFLTPLDRVRLRARIDDLGRRLRGDVDTEVALGVIERLRELSAELAERPTRRSLVLFVSPDLAAAHHLDVDVRERTVVDDTFATRDLVEQVRATSGALAATVSDRLVRAVELGPEGILPLDSRGFPLERRDDESDQLWERRTVDALRRLGGSGLPLVLFGAERRVSALLRAGGVEPAAVVKGNHDQAPWTRLRDLARPHVDAWQLHRAERSLARLEVARSRRRLATGLDEVWWLAQESRVELLVVERSYAVPVRVRDNHLVPVDPAEAEAPDVVDDAVDDLIEAVALRRGEVVIVPDGTLADTGGLAAVLRY